MGRSRAAPVSRQRDLRRVSSRGTVGLRMEKELLSVFRALNETSVRYLVVGGVAVVLHGHLRFTGDLDLVVQLTPSNVASAITALERLGYKSRLPVSAASLADPLIRKSWVEDKGMVVFPLWSPTAPGLQIDIFVTEPFPFDENYARARSVDIDGIPISVLGVSDLIAMKRKVGRPSDLADVAALERIATLQTS